MTVKYGIVGLGLMGQEHLRNLIELHTTHSYDIQVPCLADTFPDSLTTAIQIAKPIFNTIQPYASYESMLQHHAKQLDVIIIATPNFHHVHLLLYILQTYPHLHILCEKPVTTNISDCKRVLQAQKERQLLYPNALLWVGLEYRYMPPITKLIQECKQHKVGRIRMISIREHRFPFLVKVRDWNRFSKNTGGTLVEKCCHFFDLFNEIAGQQQPVSIFASGGQNVNHLQEYYDGQKSDILDNAYVIINYDGGLRAMLDLCMFAEASHNQEEVVVVGDEAKIEAFLPNHEYRYGMRGEHKVNQVQVSTIHDPRVTYAGHHYGSSQLEHMDFYQCVVDQVGKPRVSLEAGMIAVAMGIAAHVSILESREVTIQEVLDEKVKCPWV